LVILKDSRLEITLISELVLIFLYFIICFVSHILSFDLEVGTKAQPAKKVNKPEGIRDSLERFSSNYPLGLK